MPHHPIDVMRSLEREMNAQIERLKPLLVDKSYSLNERWDMYSEVAHLMPTDYWYFGARIELLEISLYDDMHINRREQISFVDFYERLVEHGEENPLVPQDKLDTWREAILASGYGSFRNDW